MSPTDALWYKDAVIYELHVRTFLDSTGDGVGDFPGLTSKLDYLQNLGVTCLWLLPFYPSPLRDDGYDIANYEDIHPSYGSMRDFRTFLREAHARNLRVVTELVINHTSDQHPWFQAARRAPAGSSKRDYYVWSETNRKYEGVRIVFSDTEHSNWTWDDEAGAYFWHRFFRHQPDLNFDNPRVRRAVLKIMRYWLDMGVDGLRLDAIPYLVEREGTTCENLPETHAVLREIRRVVDEHYHGRMLLAEANQWPADVRSFFGDADECHMAFHFPLMPRIFMALQLEDRHPIVEILRQTPDIPDSCQWAIFLRNHDELTLEVVTDEERDYMYRAYAADPQMRLNAGIRRRLAPLMENNRDRIELLYGLLFSLPGTPVIYYGDEIGMGDNVFLGDRNGVRTPMQWTGDRNGGFSRADPNRLYAPPIMDPIYGYQAINVEAQERSPFSLLNWVRRMIALRRQHQIFGRGGIQFITPSNRRVLAYLRSLGEKQVLVVANLSRSVQPVTLDVPSLAGLHPYEMRDRTPFPRIGSSPYFLSLGPYECFWFDLLKTPEPAPTVRPASAEPEPVLDTHPALYASSVWETLLDGHVRTLVERDHLREFVARRRWFGEPSRTVASARIADWALLTRVVEPSFLLLVEVTYEDGGRDLLFVPIATRAGADAVALEGETPERVLARISGARKGVLHDRLDQGIATELLGAFVQDRQLATRHGVIRARGTGGLRELGDRARDFTPRMVPDDPHTTSVAYGDSLWLDLLRTITPGPNPTREVLAHLDQATFPHVPALAGALEYESSEGWTATIGVLTRYVEHQANGWEQALDQVRRFFDRVLQKGPGAAAPASAAESPLALAGRSAPPDVLQTVGVFLEAAAMLGRRTAELHVALAAGHGDPAFDPEPLSEADRRATAHAMRRNADDALDLLRDALERVSEGDRALAQQVIDRRAQLLARFDALEALPIEATRIRIHGDYHLGHVLWNRGDFVILHFGGDLRRPLDQRRAKQSPIRDVAGMLRSFHYAAHAGLFAYAEGRPRELERLAPWARTWEAWTSAMFLRNYLAVARDAAFVPRPATHVAALVDAYLVDKAASEVRHELATRPAWAGIPLGGLLRLLQW